MLIKIGTVTSLQLDSNTNAIFFSYLEKVVNISDSASKVFI
jgi:hypothetical protein